MSNGCWVITQPSRQHVVLVNRPLSAATRAITDMSTDATAFRFEKNDRAACLVFAAFLDAESAEKPMALKRFMR